MNMWPSRGNYITGFEIKVSRSDLQRELKQGVKAESTSKYCDYWVLVTPKGLIPDNVIIPPTWGIMEYLDNKTLKFKQNHQKKIILNAHYCGLHQCFVLPIMNIFMK